MSILQFSINLGDSGWDRNNLTGEEILISNKLVEDGLLELAVTRYDIKYKITRKGEERYTLEFDQK